MIAPWRWPAELRRVSALAAAQAADLDRLRGFSAGLAAQWPDPLLVLGPDLRVTHTNPAAALAYGSDLPALLRHPDLAPALAAARNGVLGRARLQITAPVRRDVAATAMPVEGGVWLILADRSQDAALARMRSDFVANASHELRTPLASLIGFIDTLRGPARDDAPARDRFLGIMADQAARMARLIDDLLLLSRAEMSEHQPPDGVVALDAAIRQAAAALEPVAAARPAGLRLDLPACLPSVTGDADQLAQVLQNLIENAVKYGKPGGTVRVSAHAAKDGASKDGVVLCVADDGPGIARAHLPRLTERFYRVDAGRSRPAGGAGNSTGLGLAIVKHIVNRHRGQLRIESEEGVGTTVTITLPAAPHAAGAADAA